MNIKDGYVSKKVAFNTQDGLEEKIDRLTSRMNKFTAHDDHQTKQIKPKIYQGSPGSKCFLKAHVLFVLSFHGHVFFLPKCFLCFFG